MKTKVLAVVIRMTLPCFKPVPINSEIIEQIEEMKSRNKWSQYSVSTIGYDHGETFEGRSSKTFTRYGSNSQR